MKKRLMKNNWANEIYFNIKFIKVTDKRRNGSQLWEAKCSCDKIFLAIPYTVKTGKTKSCGCLRDKMRIERGRKLGKATRNYDPVISSARAIWHSRYKDGCPFNTFLKMAQLPCYYCARLPYRSYTKKGNGKPFLYNGLDRIDSSLSHIESNLITCCFDCNKAKSSLSTYEFIKLIELIYLNRNNIRH